MRLKWVVRDIRDGYGYLECRLAYMQDVPDYNTAGALDKGSNHNAYYRA